MGLRAVGGNRIKKRTHCTYVFEVIDEFLSGVDFFFFFWITKIILYALMHVSDVMVKKTKL